MNTQEIECRFLEIEKDALIKKLRELGAEDKGEVMLQETIISDPSIEWTYGLGFIRIRKSGNKISLTYKEHRKLAADGAFEIEFEISDFNKAELLFEKIGWGAARRQQKMRHTFNLNRATIDIDTWPKVPPYVEIEGESEAHLRETAALLGFEWNKVEFHDARWVIENVYNIPVGKMKHFTFDKFE